MDERWQFFFYLAAVAIWLICFLKAPKVLVTRWELIRLAALGWVFFGFPFLWNAGEVAW